ncbi:MAG: SusD/RagB family nutrient-binding outer membrane lipoprotein [Sphingobacteriia bacterium]|nr:SusD/RagB family nutrient-binding outer membrane lipoprotein [Sphingobacteriia bacterium]
MKNKSFITFSLKTMAFAIGILTIQACSKKLDSVYLNPNNPVEVDIEAVLPNAINQMTSTAAPPTGGGGGSYGCAAEAVLMARYIQYWGDVATNNSYDQMGGVYGTGSDNTGLVWAMHYYGIGANAKYIISRGRWQEKWDYVGVANALFAFSWLTLTEQYGEVILKQSFDASRSQFDYDSQEAVYDTVRKICDSAIYYLNRTDGAVSPANLAKGDTYFYGGDVNKWKKFVYAIKARSYAHLSNKTIYTTNNYADSVIKYCNLSITTNADNATQKWQGGNFSGTNNYYGPYRGNIGTLRQTAFIADLLTGASAASPFSGIIDPRTPYLLNENNNGTYKGILPGQGSSGLGTNDQPKNFWRQLFSSTSTAVPDSGRYIFNNLAPFPVITASDMQFMKAEAAYRKGDKALALTAYTNAINLSFDLLTTDYDNRIPLSKKITSASRAAYLTDPKVIPVSAANLTLSMIMLQKYIALYGYGFHETWTDLRRFHYTDIDPATGTQVYAGFTLPSVLNVYNAGKLAYRARPRYNSEYLYNIPALQTIGALASDYHTKEHWFMQP